MATKKTPIRYFDFSGGLNSGTNEFLLQNNELTAMKNVYEYKSGALDKVNGYALYGDYSLGVLTGTVRHLTEQFLVTAGYRQLIAFADSGSDLKIYSFLVNGSEEIWKVSSYVLTGKDEFIPDSTTYLDKLFVVGYDKNNNNNKLTNITRDSGGSIEDSDDDSDLEDMPGASYIEKYRDLLYVLNCNESGDNPNRVYFCSTPVAGSIDWNVDTDFIEVGSELEEITGSAVFLDKLIIFKNFSMWSYDDYELKQVGNIGCSDNRSIQIVGDTLFWMNHDGIWSWRGGDIVLVSKKIQKHIDAIDPDNFTELISYNNEDLEYHVFVGDITVDGVTYENAVFCYNIIKNTFYLKSLKNPMTAAIVHTPTILSLENKKRVFWGSDSGYIFYNGKKTDDIKTFNDEEISAFFITKPFDHGQPENEKFTGYATIFAENPSKLKMAVDVNNKNSFSESAISRIDKNISGSNVELSGRTFKYKFYEQSSSKPFSFNGFVLETDLKETNE